MAIKIKKTEFKKLQAKAALLDQLVEFIEDQYLGDLMRMTEKEKNIPLSRVKKIWR